MGKHAVLIMAHEKMDMLHDLLRVMDDRRFDFYIHIDKKCSEYGGEDFSQYVRKGSVYLVKRLNVIWGDYTQVQCEYNLIRAAVQNLHYDYLHLISGADMMLCKHKRFFDFFDSNPNREFLYYDREDSENKGVQRCDLYHFFQKNIGRRENKSTLFSRIDGFLCRIQKKIGVSRAKNIQKYIGKGANWFTISGDFASYIANQKEFIKKHFRYTICCDEVFIHTLLKMSPYADNLYCINGRGDCMRYIDWNRGNPYIFRSEDYQMLISCGKIFARKFDSAVDSDILNELYKYILEE